jgi:ZIP family zinc transporter
MWGAAGAVSLVLGAWIALRFRPRPGVVGLVLGFGAGALIGGVAYELVPGSGPVDRGTFAVVAVGALVFFGLDRVITGRPGAGRPPDTGRSIVLGALLDGVPESLVLGMSLAAGGSVSVAFLAAVFLSNLPESLGATAGMRDVGHGRRRTYGVWWTIVALSALCAGLGYAVVRAVPTADASAVQAFAAGAVLTMLANTMMPEAFIKGGNRTGLLTVLGFAVTGALSALD